MAGQPGAQEGRPAQVLVGLSIALVLVDAGAYLLIARSQSGGPHETTTLTVPFVATYMAVMALLLGLSLLDRPALVALRPAMRGAAAAGLLLLGFFALFSIGLPIFVAGVLASVVAIRSLAGPNQRQRVLTGIAAAVVAVIVLVAGSVVTQRMIQCPPTGTVKGGSSGFLTGPYHYECVDGTLTMYSGECGAMQFDANGNPTPASGC